MRIHPVVAELFHADRRTDGQTNMAKLYLLFGILWKSLKHPYRYFNSGPPDYQGVCQLEGNVRLIKRAGMNRNASQSLLKYKQALL